jgi:hypothetical protein
MRKKNIRNQFYSFRFKANRWLNEETGTFIDLLPEEPKPPSPEQGKHKNIRTPR